MKFRFHIQLSDRDYLDFNIFWSMQSPYGKKVMLTSRIICALVYLFFTLFMLCTQMRSNALHFSWILLILLCIGFALIQLAIPRIQRSAIKRQLRTLRKTGKMAFSPDAILEFEDDRLIHSTPEHKTELNYAALERVSVRDRKAIYLHLNNLSAYLLPWSCFESDAQRADFLDFIRTKCPQIDFYKT